MGRQGRKSTQLKSRKFWIMGMAILYLTVNVWIISGLIQLEECADLIVLSYQESGIEESTFDQWKENTRSGMFSGAAVWKKLKEQRVSSKDTGHEEKLTCYQVKGWPGAIFGRELAQGRYFTEGEEGVCLLDQGTAKKIYGSKNVSDLSLWVDGSLYRIAGVLKGEEPVCVIPAKEDTVYDGIAVQKNEKSKSSKQAVSQMEAVFGAAEGQIDGQLYQVTARLFYTAITAVVMVFFGRAVRRETGRRQVFLIFLTVAAGILISGVRMAAPGGDYLPTYWSDFEFFVQLYKEKTQQIQELMAHQEFVIWQEMLHIWRQTAAAGIIAAVLAASACFVPSAASYGADGNG